jgi:hypothetical protein
MANVFISHRTADGVLAEKVAARIRDAGHAVWLDEWEIGIGDSIIEKMNQGLEGASYVVVCYSAAGVNSPWMSREWMGALARQLDGVGARLLPVRLSGDGPPPVILADIKYADLVKDWDKGVADLIRVIR